MDTQAGSVQKGFCILGTLQILLLPRLLVLLIPVLLIPVPLITVPLLYYFTTSACYTRMHVHAKSHQYYYYDDDE